MADNEYYKYLNDKYGEGNWNGYDASKHSYEAINNANSVADPTKVRTYGVTNGDTALSNQLLKMYCNQDTGITNEDTGKTTYNGFSNQNDYFNRDYFTNKYDSINSNSGKRFEDNELDLLRVREMLDAYGLDDAERAYFFQQIEDANKRNGGDSYDSTYGLQAAYDAYFGTVGEDGTRSGGQYGSKNTGNAIDTTTFDYYYNTNYDEARKVYEEASDIIHDMSLDVEKELEQSGFIKGTPQFAVAYEERMNELRNDERTSGRFETYDNAKAAYDEAYSSKISGQQQTDKKIETIVLEDIDKLNKSDPTKLNLLATEYAESLYGNAFNNKLIVAGILRNPQNNPGFIKWFEEESGYYK